MVNTLIPLRRIDEMLDGFFRPRSVAPLTSNGQNVEYLPRADILEGEKDFLIRIDLPGVARDNLDINLEDQTLSIKAEREIPAPEGYQSRRRELPAKQVFGRTFNLGREIDPDRIGAKLEHGVLTITLPKSDVALPRRIDVQ